jgi:hypothetical protein
MDGKSNPTPMAVIICACCVPSSRGWSGCQHRLAASTPGCGTPLLNTNAMGCLSHGLSKKKSVLAALRLQLRTVNCCWSLQPQPQAQTSQPIFSNLCSNYTRVIMFHERQFGYHTDICTLTNPSI